MASSIGTTTVTGCRSVPIISSARGQWKDCRRKSCVVEEFKVKKIISDYEEKCRPIKKSSVSRSAFLLYPIPPPKPKRTFMYEVSKGAVGPQVSVSSSIRDNADGAFPSIYKALLDLRIICEQIAMDPVFFQRSQREALFYKKQICCQILRRILEVFRRIIASCRAFFIRCWGYMKVELPKCCPFFFGAKPDFPPEGGYSFNEKVILKMLMTSDELILNALMQTKEMQNVCILLNFREGILHRFPALKNQYSLLQKIDKFQKESQNSLNSQPAISSNEESLLQEKSSKNRSSNSEVIYETID